MRLSRSAAACVALAASIALWSTTASPQNLSEIPVRTARPNAALVQPYSPTWKGLRLKFDGEMLQGGNPRMIYAPRQWNGRVLLPWQTSIDNGPGVSGIGSTFTILDNEIYDLDIGELFARVKLDGSGLEGFLPLSILIAETSAADDSLWATDHADTIKAMACKSNVCFPFGPSDPKGRAAIAQSLTAYDLDASPLTAANSAISMLSDALDPKAQDRTAGIDAAAKFFESYVSRKAMPGPAGSLAWPNAQAVTINWGIKLSPPWYSAYANSAIALSAALMYRLTAHHDYLDTAVRAARFVGEPIERGGAEYMVAGFRLPAEYVYRDAPNVRVLDGEIISLVYLYDVVRLTGDRATLEIFLRQSMSLAMQLPFYRNPDGSYLFAAYVEAMPEHYNWTIWMALQILANATKDRRFTDAARDIRRHIPDKDCASNGC